MFPQMQHTEWLADYFVVQLLIFNFPCQNLKIQTVVSLCHCSSFSTISLIIAFWCTVIIPFDLHLGFKSNTKHCFPFLSYNYTQQNNAIKKYVNVMYQKDLLSITVLLTSAIIYKKPTSIFQ